MHEEWERSVARKIKPAEATGPRASLPRCPKCIKLVLTRTQIEMLVARTKVEDRLFLDWCTCEERRDVAVQRRERESVYIIGSRAAGYVKVGYTQTQRQRITEIAGYLPFEIETFAIMRGCPMRLERALHRHLKDSRARGEWFRLTPAVEEIIGAAQSGRLQALVTEWLAKAKPMERLDIAELLRPKSRLARMRKHG